MSSMLPNRSRIESVPSAQAALLEYYAATADHYDDAHRGTHEPEHDDALRWIGRLLPGLGIQSMLDTGCGTGRGIEYLRRHHPDIRVRGNDPSPDLLRIAVEQRGVPTDLVDCTSSTPLPYPDNSFDAVMALGVMHHVAEPDTLVREMMRVGRKAIFISDRNRFGDGRAVWRLMKWCFWRAKVWKPLFRLKNRGHDWYFSEGDGVAFSYSIFDSIGTLSRSGYRITVIPTRGSVVAFACPLFLASHALVCAIKE
ncbi:MAG: class I SAM-dependent methyltransferase [Chloroflexi bacterium]|nr:class I SAM-dependent methyltransferase [Chloroflexota bacterium]